MPHPTSYTRRIKKKCRWNFPQEGATKVSSPSCQCQKPTAAPGSNIQEALVTLSKSRRACTVPNISKKAKGSVLYTKSPIGHNTLAKTVARVCQAGGVPGFKMNHSLRVITATRLFQRGVDEQLIMACTGYRSIEGLRTYSDLQNRT